MTFDPSIVSRVQVPVTADIAAIVRASGGQTEHAMYANGFLTVRGVHQEALDAAAEPADPLFAARAGIKQAAQAELRRRLAAGMPFRGKVADIDEEQSQRRINGAVTGAILAQAQNAPFQISWRMQDNTALDLDGPGVMTLGGMVLSYFQALNAHYWSILGAADTAEGADALSQINPLAGWPDPPAEPAPQGA